jgi:hypothetical protein
MYIEIAYKKFRPKAKAFEIAQSPELVQVDVNIGPGTKSKAVVHIARSIIPLPKFTEKIEIFKTWFGSREGFEVHQLDLSEKEGQFVIEIPETKQGPHGRNRLGPAGGDAGNRLTS